MGWSLPFREEDGILTTSATPPLSILLPVRDGEATIAGAIESILSQSFAAFELLVVDDGSEDGTPEILRGLAARDSRIHLLRQEPRGIVAALELARQGARGARLARMDADDLALPGRLKAQMELMDGDPRLVAVGTHVAYFPRGEVQVGSLRYERWLNSLNDHESMERDLFVECPLPHPTFLLRADVVRWVGGYRDMGWPEDYDLVLRLWEAGGRLGKVPSVLLQWREGPTRLSRTHQVYSDEAFRRCKVHHLLRTHLADGRAVVVWGAGPVGKSFARELMAQGGILAAFVDLDPRKIGQEIHGVPVIPPGEANKFRGSFSVAAVGKGRAREEIRRTLSSLGWREMEDFVAVA
jgi:cellulose synthase/poly-beta-1,6-N-acetylglucosamine synthase-like glycosyltransferase